MKRVHQEYKKNKIRLVMYQNIKTIQLVLVAKNVHIFNEKKSNYQEVAIKWGNWLLKNNLNFVIRKLLRFNKKKLKNVKNHLCKMWDNTKIQKKF